MLQISEDPRAPQTESLSEVEIRKALLSDAVQHPATSLPLTLFAMAAVYLAVWPPILGGPAWPIILLVVSGVVAAGTFLWRYSERQVMEANAKTREFIGDLIVANASAINRHTQEIGEAYNNPVIAMDKITQAHQELFEAMDTADRLKQEGIATARENIAKLSELSSEIQQRTGALQAADAPKSIEA